MPDSAPDGVLTMFDNQSGTGHPRVWLPTSPTRPPHTATMLWQRTYPNPAGFSFGLGSARQNPDGSLIISWGALRPLFEELDAQGQRLLAVTEAAPDALAHRFLKEPLALYDRQVLLQFAGGDAEAP